MRRLGLIVAASALIIAAGAALEVIQEGIGGASAKSANSPAQQCLDEGIEPGNGNAFGKCVSEKASAFGKCVSEAAKLGEGNPAKACEELKPGNGNEDSDGGGSASSPAQECRDEGVEPGNGNAFGKCVSELASAFGKCVSGAAGPGAGSPAQACEELKPGNGNRTEITGEALPTELSIAPEQTEQVPTPTEPSVPPEETEQVPEDTAAPEGGTFANGTGGVAAPSE